MKYRKEFKEEALKLSDKIGLKKAAQQPFEFINIIVGDLSIVPYMQCRNTLSENSRDKL